MSWTTPRTWVAGEIVTAAEMNTHVRDDLNWLHDNPVGSIWNHILYNANTGAGPDANFRYFVGTGSFSETASPGWNVNAATCLFDVPITGKYLTTIGMDIVNQEGGTCAVYLVTNAGAFAMDGGRVAVNGGTDASGSIVASGFSSGPRVVTLTHGTLYKFGGYRSSGASNFNVWATLVYVGA